MSVLFEDVVELDSILEVEFCDFFDNLWVKICLYVKEDVFMVLWMLYVDEVMMGEIVCVLGKIWVGIKMMLVCVCCFICLFFEGLFD